MIGPMLALPAPHLNCSLPSCRAISGKKLKHSARAWRRRVVCRALPETPTEVIRWTAQQFEAEARKADGQLNLAKTCMLIALEEEAATQADSVISHTARDQGSSASTWSLQRLDAIAAEAIAEFQSSHCVSSDEALAALVQRYPLQALSAVNTVCFERHGYGAANRYGEPADSNLSQVLERGKGTSAALSILYMEICARMGLPLAARPLEQGRYVVVWPQIESCQLTMGGQRFVVDAYGHGGLLSQTEVQELFGVEESELQPASQHELLAALLSGLVEAHWAAALGCSPAPAFMVPLSLDTALQRRVDKLNGCSIERAAAAAYKRVLLLPGDQTLQLQYALLLYFCGRYDDAWIELSLYIQARSAAQRQSEDAMSSHNELSVAGLAETVVAGDKPLLAQALEADVFMQQQSAGAAATAVMDSSLEKAAILLEQLRLELAMSSTVHLDK